MARLGVILLTLLLAGVTGVPGVPGVPGALDDGPRPL
jgi:hypothetical protein